MYLCLFLGELRRIKKNKYVILFVFVCIIYFEKCFYLFCFSEIEPGNSSSNNQSEIPNQGNIFQSELRDQLLEHIMIVDIQINYQLNNF